MADRDPAETHRRKELTLIVLQYMREQGYEESGHRLEQESGLYFDTKHLEYLVQCGAWDDAERYLGGFIDGSEDPCSAQIFVAIRNQKYAESYHRFLMSEEGQTVKDDLKMLAPFNQKRARSAVEFEEKLRQGERLDTASGRNDVFLEIKKLIQANPLFQNKLDFPSIEDSRLKKMITQSLEQKHPSKRPKQICDLTLLNDYSCDTSCNGVRSGSKEHTTGACRGQNVKRQTQDEPPMTNTCKFALRKPDKATTCRKIVGLLYTSNGNMLLALGSDAVYNLWKRQSSCTNANNKLWQSANEILMKNGTSDGNPEEATACIALSKNKAWAISASGGKVSLFNMTKFQIRYNFMAPPPAVTFIAIHPRDINIIVFGMEDSTIQIYNFSGGKVERKLTGHQKMITGLAFSEPLNVLISSGADTQLCIWSIYRWEKINSRYIQPPASRSGDTRVQFHGNSTQFLVVHKTQLAIMDWKLEQLCCWYPTGSLGAPISSAVYSCDGLIVYAGFYDGALAAFEAASLRLLGWTAPVHIPPSMPSGGQDYPMVAAAHPSDPKQIALGMSSGEIHVVDWPHNISTVFSVDEQ